ncbi:GIY-YIG nuclease family protein [Paenibacillus sp. SEL3]
MKKWYKDRIDDRYIYGLFDSIPEVTGVYIGQTTNVERRYAQHLEHASNAWVKEQISSGRSPKLVILEKARTSQYEAYQLEVVWVQVALQQGFTIYNTDADYLAALRLWKQLEPLTKTRQMPRLDQTKDFQMKEDSNLLEHLHHSWIRLIGEK